VPDRQDEQSDKETEEESNQARIPNAHAEDKTRKPQVHRGEEREFVRQEKAGEKPKKQTGPKWETPTR
jgi:hypothetical protein